MSGPVPLIRRFTPISRHYQEHDFSLEQAWPVLDRGERRDWGLLCEDYRAVILADAGAGKTFELKAEAARLDARGHAAFFIRIEDIDEAFGSAFEVGSAGGFESWLCGAEEAWFFLDSVDEVRLEAPRAFEAALRAFATRIHDARHRAHVYVSSRPYSTATLLALSRTTREPSGRRTGRTSPRALARISVSRSGAMDFAPRNNAPITTKTASNEPNSAIRPIGR